MYCEITVGQAWVSKIAEFISSRDLGEVDDVTISGADAYIYAEVNIEDPDELQDLIQIELNMAGYLSVAELV